MPCMVFVVFCFVVSAELAFMYKLNFVLFLPSHYWIQHKLALHLEMIEVYLVSILEL